MSSFQSSAGVVEAGAGVLETPHRGMMKRGGGALWECQAPLLIDN